VEEKGAVVRLALNAADRLEQELNRIATPLRAVCLCPASDPFPVSLEAQQQTAWVITVLARHDVQAWLTTRGWIRSAALGTLARHRDLVRVRISLTTVERSFHRGLEPGTLSPRLRLRQIKKLTSLGIPVQVAVEPLVAGLTDDRQNLLDLLEALAAAGVRHVTSGYLTLPIGAESHWRSQLEPRGWDALVLDPYADGPMLRAGRGSQLRYLPKVQRQRGYACLMALAAPLGITATVSAASNPDFARPAPDRLHVQPRLPFRSLQS
jgi:DNA repair photolyase